MKHIRICLWLWASCMLCTLATGCAALSLFETHHYHYQGTPEIDKRLDSLEKRMAALEAAHNAAPNAYAPGAHAFPAGAVPQFPPPMMPGR